MTNLAFLRYRFSAFHHFIAEQLGQLKQLGTILVLFMYTAVAGLVLLVYLALGKILVADELAKVLVVALIVAQSELSVALSQGATDNKHRLFQRTLVKRFMRNVADIVMGLAGNLLFLLCLPLLLSIELDKWQQAGHFLIFCLCLFASGLVATFKPARIKSYSICVIVLPMLFDWQLVTLLNTYLLLLTVIFLLPSQQYVNLRIKLPLGFWLSYHWHNLAEIWWRLLLLLALLVSANVLYTERPVLDFFIHCFISPFVVYIASSQQLNQNEYVAQHVHYINSMGTPKKLLIGQFLAPSSLLLIGLLPLQSITLELPSLVIFTVSGILAILFAKRKPTHYALGWFVISGITITLSYWLH
ncbi:DUF6136 family protein [Pseudoalteromonas sp.]|uniref:DUF6136 family protein n=1 Tax=Pseudoalteromonas sp. TaxID=53249 RepID=UPI0035691CB8